MDTVIDVVKLMVYIVGMWTLIKFSLVRTASRRHKMVNRGARERAVEISDLERRMQEADHELWPRRTPEEHKHTNCSICGPGPLMQGMVPSRFTHPFYNRVSEETSDGYGRMYTVERLKAALPEYAELVTSEIIKDQKYTGQHSIMLDIDLPATLMESSTNGHYHLYIDHPLSWRQYERLLKALCRAGVIEKGFYAAALREQSTSLRPPWVKKPLSPPTAYVQKTVRRRGKRKT